MTFEIPQCAKLNGSKFLLLNPHAEYKFKIKRENLLNLIQSSMLIIF